MFSALREQAAAVRRCGSLYFAALLPEDRILNAFGKARSIGQSWIYTKAATVWVFLSQCLSPDHSCREAVARLVAWRIGQGKKPCSAETGAYCSARNRIPEVALHRLVRQSGQECEQAAPQAWLWHGRRTCIVDGTTVTMPDTAKNQAKYPQLKAQTPGCGFPIARILVVFSLAVGAVLDAAIAPYSGKQTGENSLFRTLHKLLHRGDVVLADRYFGGWFDIALLVRRGVDVVVRKHQLRATDFRTGQRFGKEDHWVQWLKPARPKWMSPACYARLPDRLELREMRVRVIQPGFRTRCLLVVTTMLAAEEYTASEIALLYRQRWQAELYLRSIKCILEMDHLRCKTPLRVRKEIWTHLLGYNLIRRVMAATAISSKRRPSSISFKGTLQTLNAFLPMLHVRIDVDHWLRSLFQAILTHREGNRPDRIEPRVRKRRPKKYPLMRVPRQTYRSQLLDRG